MSVRYRKVPQVSDHSDTEDDEAELLNTGQYLNQSFWISNQSFWISTRSECVELDPDPERQREIGYYCSGVALLVFILK
jgi:hypothetical protein